MSEENISEDINQPKKSNEQLRQEWVEGIGMTPDQARKRLEDLGWDDSTWYKVGKEGGSHFFTSAYSCGKRR